MSEKLPCGIVRDLLPLYADGLTSPETTEAVKAHLEGCSECREALRVMKEGEPEAACEPEKEAREIDYLKKVKKRSVTPAIVAGCVALLAIAGVMLRFFVIGDHTDIYLAAEPDRALSMSASAEGKDVTVSIDTSGSGLAVSGVSFRELGVGHVRVEPRLVPELFFKSGKVEKTYHADSDVVMIFDCFGSPVWESGTEISQRIQSLLRKRVLDIGDDAAVGELIKFADFSLPAHTFYELQTSSEPYGISISNVGFSEYHSREHFTCQEYELPVIDGKYRRLACILLACVKDLAYVEYRAVPDNIDTVIEGRLTEKDAYEYVKLFADGRELKASDIKGFAQGAASLQQLAEILDDPNWFSIYSSDPKMFGR
ncbi:MAG: zf-HC2 domain-containing protein [Firmicutes bacterium]|nr:zf-HC2 domain-containing protein [Bacillota bacterium]